MAKGSELKKGDRVRFNQSNGQAKEGDLGTVTDVERSVVTEQALVDVKLDNGKEGSWYAKRMDKIEAAAELKNGDRVRFTGTKQDLSDVGIGSEGSVKEIMSEVGTVDGDPSGRDVITSWPSGATWYLKLDTLEKVEADEPDWDPMTETLQLGDLVEVVYKSHQHTGKQGRITRVDAGLGHYDVDGGFSKSERPSSGVENGKGRWPRECLKLLEKADGTSHAAKVEDTPPPEKFQKGDEVRILHTVKELSEMGHNVVQAARMSRRQGKIILGDGSEPKWYVDVPDVGGTWCHTDKLEKLSA